MKTRPRYPIRQSLLVLLYLVTTNLFSQNDYVEPRYKEVDLGRIRPKGWLRDQLNTMRENSTGHLDEVHAKISYKNNGWLGGRGDNWEETPYWLDGAVPLAYLLDDKALQEKVFQYIDWNIENQRPSGFLDPSLIGNDKQEMKWMWKIARKAAIGGPEW